MNWVQNCDQCMYFLQVNNGTRLTLALQLALHPFNEMQDVLIRKSFDNYGTLVKSMFTRKN